MKSMQVQTLPTVAYQTQPNPIKSNQDQSTDVASRFSVPYGSKNALASKAKGKQTLVPIDASRTPVK